MCKNCWGCQCQQVQPIIAPTNVCTTYQNRYVEQPIICPVECRTVQNTVYVPRYYPRYYHTCVQENRC